METVAKDGTSLDDKPESLPSPMPTQLSELEGEGEPGVRAETAGAKGSQRWVVGGWAGDGVQHISVLLVDISDRHHHLLKDLLVVRLFQFWWDCDELD